ncbi:hypothetical protein EVAR_65878_1 [Eumeta japonica]|uniref:Uncharacterized protein n=1 Tax=Eumeta variegata TaxID=151549 RepID=A0A4C1ZFE5_EUMVA|nr:hypothetical protein EVAR_65878_1 [Eumeta japonica]
MWPCIHHGVLQRGAIYKYDPDVRMVLSVCIRFGFFQIGTVTGSGNEVEDERAGTKVDIKIEMERERQLTIWAAGCEEKLINEMMVVSWRFNAVTALIIAAMSLQVIAVRYLHTAYRNGLHAGNQIRREAYLLRSVTEWRAADVHERAFRRKSARRARTMRWVTTADGARARERVTPSSSECDSFDELLQLQYE